MIYHKNMVTVVRRRSKYAEAVKVSLRHFGHATNAQICDDLRNLYPHLSDTTVHRITQRLHDDGEIGFAFLDRYGAMVYDYRTLPHDHFYCERCDQLQDMYLPVDCRNRIAQAITPCVMSESIKIVGTCQACRHDQ